MSAAIRAALRTVADARAAHVAYAEELSRARAAFSIEYAALIAAEALTKQSVATAEADAKALLLAHYARTKEKKPVVGGEVKIGKEYIYDPDKALAWAKETKLCLLPESLDEGAFKKIAAATPLPFVTTQEKPQAQIATQLNAALLVEPVTEEPAPL
jgi:hypothetical protein